MILHEFTYLIFDIKIYKCEDNVGQAWAELGYTWVTNCQLVQKKNSDSKSKLTLGKLSLSWVGEWVGATLWLQTDHLMLDEFS